MAWRVAVTVGHSAVETFLIQYPIGHLGLLISNVLAIGEGEKL